MSCPIPQITAAPTPPTTAPIGPPVIPPTMAPPAMFPHSPTALPVFVYPKCSRIICVMSATIATPWPASVKAPFNVSLRTSLETIILIISFANSSFPIVVYDPLILVSSCPTSFTSVVIAFVTLDDISAPMILRVSRSILAFVSL